MDKKQLTEQEIRTRYITPALIAGGWQHAQMREEYTFTAGRIEVTGNYARRSADRKRVDYLLYYTPDVPLAVVEAKDNQHEPSAGMQQALEYADLLDVPFVYTSNGDCFVEHDRTATAAPVERTLALDAFPSPAELWARYTRTPNLGGDAPAALLQQGHIDRAGRAPRYYQTVAINRAVAAAGEGRRRLLLVMATGTGKTYTAFQIIWRLWSAGRVRRVLFLADRNILIDQTMTNDFKHFGDKMTKITGRQIDKSFEIYLALYQGISGTQAWQDVYRQFSPQFFDLVVVDECHRGSAAEDSAWREVLEYFTSAIQIGLTATPRETAEISNIDYFGPPIYTYSLRQGIDDGFLAPFRVIRIDLDKDLDGWRPARGAVDRYGVPIPDDLYTRPDFDRTVVLAARTRLVAERVTAYLKQHGRMQKTIVFCEDVDHAERMRQELVNANADLAAANRRYVVRITGDNGVGKAELDNFIDPAERYPVIATTSRLMSTGVDAQTTHLIVLDRTINSMTEFKQIIGRGTRIREDYGKRFFTIMDFRDVTRLFADPDFDGDPVQVYTGGLPDDPSAGPEPGPEGGSGRSFGGGPGDGVSGGEPGSSGGEEAAPNRRAKFYVDGVEVNILAERVLVRDAYGNLRTLSYVEFSRENLLKGYGTLDAFLNCWQAAERKTALLAELAEAGFMLEELQAQLPGLALDPFDLICYVAYDRPPLTRRERARRTRAAVAWERYRAEARRILEVLLDKYADEGIASLEELRDPARLAQLLQLEPFRALGSPVEIVKLFGGRDQFIAAVTAIEQDLYAA
jgi:type I restriction enzyme R subunit